VSDCLDEPGQVETDEGSSSGSDDEVLKDAALLCFSSILQEAQRLAVEAQGDMCLMQKKWSQHTRTSRETVRRQKKARDDLASKGFLPLQEFMLKMQDKDNLKKQVHTKARAIGISRTSTRPLQEEEESSGDEESSSGIWHNPNDLGNVATSHVDTGNPGHSIHLVAEEPDDSSVEGEPQNHPSMSHFIKARCWSHRAHTVVEEEEEGNIIEGDTNMLLGAKNHIRKT
jgi:hypothetical protein